MNTGCAEPEPKTVRVDPDTVPFEEERNALDAVRLAVILAEPETSRAWAGVAVRMPTSPLEVTYRMLFNVLLSTSNRTPVEPETCSLAEGFVSPTPKFPLLLTNRKVEEPLVSWNDAEFTFTEAVTEPVAIWFVAEAPPALRANEAVRAKEELITLFEPNGPNTFEAVTYEEVIALFAQEDVATKLAVCASVTKDAVLAKELETEFNTYDAV